MNTSTPLFLSSLESTRFKPVRQCHMLGQLKFDTGKNVVVMRISPPLIGHEFNREFDIETVFMTHRHEGDNILNINKFPLFVFIFIAKNIEAVNKNILTKEEVEVIGWGELYRTETDALNHSFD